MQEINHVYLEKLKSCIDHLVFMEKLEYELEKFVLLGKTALGQFDYSVLSNKSKAV